MPTEAALPATRTGSTAPRRMLALAQATSAFATICDESIETFLRAIGLRSGIGRQRAGGSKLDARTSAGVPIAHGNFNAPHRYFHDANAGRALSQRDRSIDRSSVNSTQFDQIEFGGLRSQFRNRA